MCQDAAEVADAACAVYLLASMMTQLQVGAWSSEGSTGGTAESRSQPPQWLLFASSTSISCIVSYIAGGAAAAAAAAAAAEEEEEEEEEEAAAAKPRRAVSAAATRGRAARLSPRCRSEVDRWQPQPRCLSTAVTSGGEGGRGSVGDAADAEIDEL